jgi:3-deoxy-D-arabino-heptulosonate 7-phosphate (DAHP) synthase
MGLGGDIIVIGHGNTKDNIDLLKNGIIHGVIYMNQYTQTVNAIRSVCDYILGTNENKELILVEIGIKIKENA